MTNAKPIRRIAVFGTGVIGASWTALFLARGLHVVATDIAPNAEASLRMTFFVWALVHVFSLPQLQNRLRVQHQWLWSYFTGQRSSRLIPEPSEIG